MIINLISGPRNISTALMYSFSQHSKVKVVDEPFYGYYLTHTGIDHPGREEIIASMPHSQDQIWQQIKTLSDKYEVVFLKNMAHHHEGLNLSYLSEVKNVFLIRDPKQLIASFAEVITSPTIQDIGLKHEVELLSYILKETRKKPIVIDSNTVLENPENGLKILCDQLNLQFQSSMLSWSKGPIKEDGIWAKYWYKNVHNSSKFAKQKTSERPLPVHCKALYAEALPYFEKLKKYI